MKVNGKMLPVAEPVTLLEFLLQAGYEISRIAVEMDGAIVPKKNYETVQLHDDAVLEVVTFVGGG